MIIENFDIATDLVVEFLLPDEQSNIFILGLSDLGGTDVLGGLSLFVLGTSLLGSTDVLGEGSARTWQPAQAVVTAFESSLGGSVQDSIFFQAESATARITIQSYDWDPNVNKNIRTNTAIRLRIDNGVVDQTLFTGYLDTLSVSYYPDGPNLIQISARDLYAKIVNSILTTWDSTGYGADMTPLEAITLAVQTAGYSVSPYSQDSAGLLPTGTDTDIQANGPINDALTVGLGLLWIDPVTETLIHIPRPTSLSGTVTTWTVGNNHGEPYHLCMSDIGIEADSDTIFNNIVVSLTSNPATSVNVYNTDSIELYGESPLSIDINTTDSTELTRWANAVFGNTADKLVKTVETPTIDRDGNLTEAAIFTPGTLLGVNFVKDSLAINDYYTITKVAHSIDANGWYTTLELWKENN